MATSLSPTSLKAPPPSAVHFPHHHSFNPSALFFFLVLFAVVFVPAVIYAFFFTVPCPRIPSFRRPPPPPPPPHAGASDAGQSIDLTSLVKHREEEGGRGDECTVCLSPFADGEELRRITSCDHSFHASCVDAWLRSHPSCPICRAPVGTKRRREVSAPAAAGGNDYLQGLPDSSNLV